MSETKKNKNYQVKKTNRGGYNYKIEGAEVFLYFDAEQTNGMVSGGFGMWKAYPIFNGEVLWSAPFDADAELWYDRKKDFVRDLENNPQVVIEQTKAGLAAHAAFLDQCGATAPSLCDGVEAFNKFHTNQS